jgi:hypothetical protein
MPDSIQKHLPAPLRPRGQLEILIVAVLAAASMWFYFDRILVGYQLADAAAHERPRGNLSDLYPRWLGARELLLHRRNPYGDDITLEIQKGYYGRVIDPSRPNDPKDRQGFAYPAYVVFILGPLVGFPFQSVQIFFYWLLVGLTAATVWLWLHTLRWRLSPLDIAICIALTLGSVPAVQGIKLEQLSLLAAGLLAASAACVASGFLFCGGALLALATIKPQLAWPLVAWLLLWTLTDFRRRRRLLFGFLLLMTLLLAGAELVLPGWGPMFIHAVQQYHRYTQNQSVLDELVPGTFSGKILSAMATVACGHLLWRLRGVASDAIEFGRAVALVMAFTVLVVPMYAPYNQVLLLPAILTSFRDRKLLVSRAQSVRFVFQAGALAVAWQWIASAALCVFYELASLEFALKGWKLPFFATFIVPVIVFALVFVNVRSGQQRTTV